MNSVHLLGRITKEIEIKQTPNGIPYTTFVLAVNRPYKNDSGEQPTDFIKCLAWRNIAENLAKLTAKGSMIALDGTINTRNYENQAGYTVYQTDIMVNRFYLVESKSQTDQRRYQNQNNTYSQTEDDKTSEEYNDYINNESYDDFDYEEPEESLPF